MRASSWLFANSLSQKNYPTQEMIIWDISGGAHHSKRDNGAPMIGKRCFKGQIALGSKHVKSYFIGGLELNSSSPNSQELDLQTRPIYSRVLRSLSNKLVKQNCKSGVANISFSH